MRLKAPYLRSNLSEWEDNSPSSGRSNSTAARSVWSFPDGGSIDWCIRTNETSTQREESQQSRRAVSRKEEQLLDFGTEAYKKYRVLKWLWGYRICKVQ